MWLVHSKGLLHLDSTNGWQQFFFVLTQATSKRPLLHLFHNHQSASIYRLVTNYRKNQHKKSRKLVMLGKGFTRSCQNSFNVSSYWFSKSLHSTGGLNTIFQKIFLHLVFWWRWWTVLPTTSKLCLIVINGLMISVQIHKELSQYWNKVWNCLKSSRIKYQHPQSIHWHIQ